MSLNDSSSSGNAADSVDIDIVPIDSDSIDVVRLLERVRDHSPCCLDDLVDRSGGGDVRSPRESTSAEGILEFPARIGRFRILGTLGEGGFGMVFLAHDPELDREVALKIPRAETLLSKEARVRFINEGKAIAKFDHPHVAPVLEAGSFGPICYLITAYCRGGSLAQLLAPRTATNSEKLDRASTVLNYQDAAALICGIAEAVHHAHERGLLHRDLKPANIVFDTDGDTARIGEGSLAAKARLVDFGLAKAVDVDFQHTKTGASLGTPDYTSPEQSTNSQVGRATDIFSLGAILYELLTGEPPFRRASAIETLMAVREDVPVPPRRVSSSCPKDIEAI